MEAEAAILAELRQLLAEQRRTNLLLAALLDGKRKPAKDDVREEMGPLVETMWNNIGPCWFTISDLVSQCTAKRELREAVSAVFGEDDPKDKNRSRRIGCALRQCKNNPINGYVVQSDNKGRLKSGTVWKIERACDEYGISGHAQFDESMTQLAR